MKTSNQEPARYEWGPFPLGDREVCSENRAQRTLRHKDHKEGKRGIK